MAKMKAYLMTMSDRYELMCADTSKVKASDRLSCAPRDVVRMDEHDPDSAAVRLALAFPRTVWRRDTRPLGLAWEYWRYYDGETPALPPVTLRISADTVTLDVALDLITVYGGDRRDRHKHELWLRDLMVEHLTKAGAIRHELVVGPSPPPEVS